jgi:hypothetical protein
MGVLKSRFHCTNRRGITSFSVMAEVVKVEHAASLFLGPDEHSKQASGMFYNAN